LITPVECLPTRGETVVGGNYTLVPGGKGANQALAAALGAVEGQRVAMVGKIGRDAWGEAALAKLRDAGVDLSLVAKGDGHTACGFISVDRQGQTLITVSPGANMETKAEVLRALRPALGPRDWLVLQMEVTLAENWRALAHARQAGARCVLNLAPAMAVDGDVLSQLDMLIVNQPEAQLLGSVLGIGSSDHLAIAREIARRHELTCIATLGEHGSVAIEANGRGWRVGRIDVDVVDTTGAGDAYAGYLIAALDRGLALPEAMRFASTGASLSCETRGAQSAYLGRAEIERRMQALAPTAAL
jgi:ribokinase